MKFAIQINASPYHSNAGQTAYQFINAALALGHEIIRVFFYHDGIYPDGPIFLFVCPGWHQCQQQPS